MLASTRRCQQLYGNEMNTADVAAISASLTTPFLLHRVAQSDHFSVYLYLCQGFVAKHRHFTQDELFFVINGIMSIETEVGTVTLRDDEYTVVPRGAAHLSGSVLQTTVMLFQGHTDPDRKNGHGRLTGDSVRGGLPKGDFRPETGDLPEPFHPQHLAQVDEMSLRLVAGVGTTPWHKHALHDEMLWLREGSLDVGMAHDGTTMEENQILVIPRDTIHRLSASQPAVALGLIHGKVSAHAHMGLMGETGLD